MCDYQTGWLLSWQPRTGLAACLINWPAEQVTCWLTDQHITSGEIQHIENGTIVTILQTIFSNAFPKWKPVHFDSNWIDIWSQWSNYQYASIASDDFDQTFIWVNDQFTNI